MSPSAGACPLCKAPRFVQTTTGTDVGSPLEKEAGLLLLLDCAPLFGNDR